jgi:hypothetical protein
MGRSNAAFHRLEITHTPHPKLSSIIQITASHPDHGIVGELDLSSDKGGRTVKHLFVPDTFRRQGIATAMWSYAKNNGMNPKHDSFQTVEGHKWAEAVGE